LNEPVVRSSSAQAQQALRREHDQRPWLGQARLAAQEVEVLGGGGGVREADVALGAELDEPLDARARMLRSGALVAMREQQRQARRLTPLGLAGGDELINDHLGGVDEVAELRLPEDQRFR
jgi:hypothetical protein